MVTRTRRASAKKKAEEGIKVGYGKYVYQHVPGWAKLPKGYEFGHCVGVAIDSKDRVYVYNRSDHPMMVFDTEGNLINSWGKGIVGSAHHAFAGPDDAIFTTDIGDHTVRRWTAEGKVEMTLGKPNDPPPAMSGKPFNRPTDVTVAPDGSLYITDGYGNARVHRYTADGKHILSWGEPGEGPGQFKTPHGVRVDASGQVFVVDRENFRIQVFKEDGQFVRQFRGMNRPDQVVINPDGVLMVPELGFRTGFAPNSPPPNPVAPPSGIKFMTPTGQWVGGWGMSTEAPGDLLAAHAVALDSTGAMYIGETLIGHRVQKFVRVK